MEDGPVALDSPQSPDSAASIARFFLEKFYNFFSSGIESSRRTHLVPVEGKTDDYEEEDVIQTRFERFLQEKLDLPSSDNGIYLARTVAPILTKTLAEVSYFSIC